MPTHIGQTECRFFTLAQRNVEPNQFLNMFRNVCFWSEQYGYDGVLIFTGNDVAFDPWILAQDLLTNTKRQKPIIAVNPLYMHPFTVAKMAGSLAVAYERSVILNMVTGTALSYLEALSEQLNHDQRYERLLEYMTIISLLVRSRAPVSFSGTHYTIKDAQLPLNIPLSLQPEYMLAGQSAMAMRVCAITQSIGMTMLPPTLSDFNRAKAVHFGIVARKSKADAWKGAHLMFPEDPEGQKVQRLSMENTDSAWKEKMYGYTATDVRSPGFWIEPFRNFKADCPYVVGSYEEIAEGIRQLVNLGANTFIFDIPPWQTEFRHVSKVLEIAGDLHL